MTLYNRYNSPRPVWGGSGAPGLCRRPLEYPAEKPRDELEGAGELVCPNSPLARRRLGCDKNPTRLQLALYWHTHQGAVLSP